MEEQISEFNKRNSQIADKIEDVQELCIANRAIARYFFAEWLGFEEGDGSDGADALEYLYQRGLNDETIRLFMLGYVPSHMYDIINTADFSIDKYDLEKSGLLLKSTDESGKKRWLAGDSIIIPISDPTGNIMSFCIHAFHGSRPRFLNMYDSFFYQKSFTVFGLHLAKWSGSDHFILCEGYFDVMLLHQNGFNSAVMPMGGGIPTREQARLMKVYKEKIVVCCDTDRAGRLLALRSAELLQQEGMQVTIAELPVGKDPAEIMRYQNGREIFEDALENAKSIKEFAEEKNPWTFSVLGSVFKKGGWQGYQTTVTAYVTDDEYELLRLYRENNCSFDSIAELYDLRKKSL